MHRSLRLILAALLLVAAVAACTKEDDAAEEESFSFIIYPGARYLQPLTETTKQAHKTMKPNMDPPPIAIYDTDATVEDVAAFYAKTYNYRQVEANNQGAGRPHAYYRDGDLGNDARAIEPLLQKMKVPTDVSKAVGTYRAAEIEPLPHRPRVTIQRPYFDVTTSQVVDRTLILMSR